MKKYLAVVQEDVADEGYVGAIKVFTEKEAKEVCGVCTGFGNIDGDVLEYSIDDMSEISDEDVKVLKKFGIDDIEFGCCFFIDESERDDYFSDDEEDEEY